MGSGAIPQVEIDQTLVRGIDVSGWPKGTLMVAPAWLMVELGGSFFLAALVQTAVFLPMFLLALLALPAGVLADTTDRCG